MKAKEAASAPGIDQLERELAWEKHKQKYSRTLRSTVYALVVVAAIAVLAATIFFPVLQIYGSSMSPTVNEGEIVVALKGSKLEVGEVAAFWFENKLLVKRVIACPGQWVNIDSEGNVYVDGELLDEPYVMDKSFGECNIDLPCQVPDGHYFILGDHRNISQDSRITSVGCVDEERFVGKLVFRVWPFEAFGRIK